MLGSVYDLEFALNLKLLPALAFVPIDDVMMAFEKIISSIKFILPEIKLVVNYFEKNYVGRKAIRDPLFSHNLWNCYSSVLERLPRTNNAVEGWHKGFNELTLANPTIWRFITCIKGEQAKNVLLLNQILTGREPALKKKNTKTWMRKYIKL